MQRSFCYLILLLSNFLLLCCGGILEKVSTSSLRAYSTNQGESTFFSFTFQTQNAIPKNTFIEIGFPNEFSTDLFPTNLECAIQLTGQDYEQKDCTFNNDDNIIHVTLDSLLIAQYTLVVGQIQIPVTRYSTSQFKIQTLYNDAVVDRNEMFGFLSFSPQPKQLYNPQIYRVSNARISEGSSWEFTFTTSNTYSMGNTVRFTFPDGFWSKQAMCEVKGLSGDNPKAVIMHNYRIISCYKIQKTLVAGGKEMQSIKIINMVNPDYSGILQGFLIEVMDSDTSIILEKVLFPGNVQILPGVLQSTYESENNYKRATSKYAFFINLVNKVDQTGRLYINFTNDWTMANPNCSIVQGFNSLQSGQNSVSCRLIPNANSYVIDNFQYIDASQRLIVIMQLFSPQVENRYGVTIATYNTKRNSFIDMNTVDILINETYGLNLIWRAHPIKSPIRLKAGQTGPLEIIFFLKRNLPQTNVGTMGKFRIEIFPPIQYPPPQNGVFKCFFYATVPAQSCTYQVVGIEKTIIYVKTPELFNFKESEIPITITTEGPVPGQAAGITLDPLVKRYLFHIQMWDCDCDLTDSPPTPPIEVYFTEWIPEYFPVPPQDFYAEAAVTQRNEFTFLSINYTFHCQQPSNPLLEFDDRYIGYERSYKFRIEFQTTTNAWEVGLGYTPDQVYQRFPCTVTGDIAQDSDLIHCDLYPFSTKTPYIEVYGMKTSAIINDATIQIYIPRIKINNVNPMRAYITFKVLEETPGMLDEQVELYHIDYDLFTVQNIPPIQTTTPITGVATLSTNIVNKSPGHTYTVSSLLTANADGFIFQLPQAFQLTQTSFACGVHHCTSFGETVNWIYLKVNGPLSTSPVFTISPGLIKSPPYEDSWDYNMWVVKDGAVREKYSFPVGIAPEPITISTFYPTVNSIFYKNTETEFEIAFTTKNPHPDNWYFTIVFLSSKLILQNTPNFFCQFNQPALDHQGALCKANAANSITVHNLRAIGAGVAVQLIIYLKTENTSPSTPYLNMETFYSKIIQKRVDIMLNRLIDTGSLLLQFIALNKFTVEHPINRNVIYPEQAELGIQPGNIGPFEGIFRPQSNSVDKLRLTMDGDFKTPNQAVDLLFCMLNGVRVHCSQSAPYLNNPLQIVVQRDSVTISNTNDNTFMITTEFVSPYNGIIFPNVQGVYKLFIEFLNASDYVLEHHTTFIKISPPPLLNLQILSEIKSKNQKNMFTFKFQVGSAVPAFSAGGRIYLEFPTTDSNTNSAIFDNALGFSNNGDVVGCWSNPDYKLVPENAANNQLRCVVVKAQDGSPAFIEVMYFAALVPQDFVEIKVVNVQNPNVNRYDCWLGVKVFKHDGAIDVETLVTAAQNAGASKNIDVGTITIIHHQRSIVLLDIQNDISTSILNHPYNTALQFPVGAIVEGGSSTMTHTIWYNMNFDAGDIFISEIPKQLLPLSMVGNGNITTCDTATYEYCIVIYDYNWVIFKVKQGVSIAAGVNQPASIEISALPYSVPQIDTPFISHVWQGGMYLGNVQQKVTAATWDSLISTFSSTSITIVGDGGKYVKGRKQAEIVVSFSNNKRLVAEGSIEIKFPTVFTTVYQHCRSAITIGSTLYSQAGDFVGEVGCQIQNGQSWVITGFKNLAANSAIKIYGLVDLPIASGVSPDIQIFTYSDSHSTDIHNNGMLVGRKQNVPGLTIAAIDPLNIKEELLLVDTKPLRPSYVGPLKIKFQFASQILRSNSEYVEIRLFRDEIHGSNTNGFQDEQTNINNNYFICYFQEVTLIGGNNGRIYGCNLIYSTSSSPYYYSYKLYPHTTLEANVEYILVIANSQLTTAVNQIRYPTQPGIFRIDLLAKSATILYTHYIQVYSTSTLVQKVRSYVSLSAEWNALDVSIRPQTAITANTDLLIIQIPTMSMDAIPLYDDFAGTGVQEYYEQLIFDLLSTNVAGLTQDKVICRMFKGSQLGKQAVRIACNFLVTINSGSDVRLIFSITNPSVLPGHEEFYPVIIYSYAPTTSSPVVYKNFDIVEKAIFVYDGPIGGPTANTDAFTYSIPTAASTGDLGFTTSHSATLQAEKEDWYILKFNFPFWLNSTSQVTSDYVYYGAGTQTGTSIIIAKYMRLIIFQPGLATAGGPLTAGTAVQIKTIWNNPNYKMQTNAERTVVGYASFGYTRRSEKVAYSQLLPQVTILTPLVDLTITSYTGIASPFDANQLNDYIFKFTTINFDITKTIIILVPASIVFNNPDCVQAEGSNIEISRCWIDTTNNYIWINVYNQSALAYSGASPLTLAFMTRNLGVTNPTANVAFSNFQMKFYSWQAATAPTISFADNTYVFQAKLSAIGGGPLSISNTYTSFPLPAYFYWPYDRYIDDAPLTDTSGGTTPQRAPIQVEFMNPVTLPSLIGMVGAYHAIKIKYPSSFSLDSTTAGTVLSNQDITINKPTCHINGKLRIDLSGSNQYCTIATGSRTITVHFQEGYAQDARIHVRASIVDPKAFPVVDGFKWQSTQLSVDRFIVSLTPYAASSPVTYTMITDSQPLACNMGSNSVIDNKIRAFSVSYHSSKLANQPNYIVFNIKMSAVNLVQMLVFEFELLNEDFDLQYATLTTFLGLSAGDRFPCTVDGTVITPNNGAQILCIIEPGDNTRFGRPIRIIMTNIVIATTGTGSVKMIINNPDANKWLNVKVKAYGSSSTDPFASDKILRGWYDLENALTSTTIVAYTGGAQKGTSSSVTVNIKAGSFIGKTSTDFEIDYKASATSMKSGDIALVYLPLRDPTHENMCSVTSGQQNYMLYGSQDTTTGTLYAIVIVAMSGTVAQNGKYTMSGVQCNYIDETAQWLFMEFPSTDGSKSVYTEATGTFSDASVYTTATANTPDLSFISLTYSQSVLGETGYAILELQLPNIAQINYVYTETAIIQFKFDGSTDWLQWNSATQCAVMEGVQNANRRYISPTCVIDYTQPYIELRNFTTISYTTNNIKIIFLQTNAAVQPVAASNSITMHIWHNDIAKSKVPVNNPTHGYCSYYVQKTGLTYPQYSISSSIYTKVTNTLITYISATSLKFSFTVNPSQNLGGEVLDAGGLHQASTIYIKLNFPQITFTSAVISTAKLVSSQNQVYPANLAWTSSAVSGNYFTISFVDLYLQETSGPNEVWSAGSEYRFEVTFTGFSALPTAHQHFFDIELKVDSTVKETGYSSTVFSKPITTSLSLFTLTKQAGEVTELQLTLTQPHVTSFDFDKVIYLEFLGSAWPTGDIIRDLDTTVDLIEISCQCDQGTPKCYRHLKRANWYSHSVSINFASTVTSTTTFSCYIPEVQLPSSSGSNNWNVGIAVVDPDAVYSFTGSSYGTLLYSTITLTEAVSPSTIALTVSSPPVYNQIITFPTQANYAYGATTLSWSSGSQLYQPVFYIYMGKNGHSPSTCPSTSTSFCRQYALSHAVVFKLSSTSWLNSHSMVSHNYKVPLYKDPAITTYNVQFRVIDNYASSGNYQKVISLYSSNIANSLTLNQGTSSMLVNHYGTILAKLPSTYTISIPIINYGLVVDPAGNSGLVLVEIPSSSSVTIIKQSCIAYVEKSTQQPSCQYVNNAGNHQFWIRPYVTQINQLLKLFIVINLENPNQSTLAGTFKVYRVYTNAVTNTPEQLSTALSVALDNTFASNTLLSSTYVKNYWFAPKILHKSGITNTPLRFMFKLNNGGDPPASTQLVIKFLNSAWTKGTNTPRCYVREFNAATNNAAYKTLNTPCAYDDTNKQYTVSQPYLHNFKDNTLYEVVLGAAFLSQMSFTNNPSTPYQVQFWVQYTSPSLTNLYYQITQQYQYQHQNFMTSFSAQYLTTQWGKSNSIQLSFTPATAVTNTYQFPKNYIELTFPELTIASVSPLTAGDELPCALLSSGQPASFASPSQSVRCIATENNYDQLVIRLEMIQSYTSTAISLVIDDFAMPLPSDYTHFNIELAAHVRQSDYLVYKQLMSQIFLIDHLSTSTEAISTGVAFQTQSNSNLLGKQGQISSAFTWPVTGGTGTNVLGEKVRLKLGKNNGFFACPGNVLSASTTIIQDSTNYQILWHNPKNNYVVLNTINSKGYNAAQTLKINSIWSPSSSQLAPYSATPSMRVEIYKAYKFVNYIDNSYPPSSFYTVNTNDAIQINSVSIPLTNYVAGQPQLFQFTIVYQYSQIELTNLDLRYIEIEATSGITAFDNCHLKNSNSPFKLCSLKNSTVLVISVLDSIITAGELLYVYAQVSSATINFSIRWYCSDGSLHASKTTSATVTAPSGSASLPTLSHLFNQMHFWALTAGYQELQETPFVAGSAGPLSKLNFIITTTQNLQYAASSPAHFINITVPGSSNYVPSLTTDPLICFIIPMMSALTQFGLPQKASACTIDTSGTNYFYKVSPNTQDTPPGIYVVSIQFDYWKQASTKFTIPTTSTRSELLFIVSGATLASQTDSLIINIIKPYTSVGITHNSLQVGQNDIIEMQLAPSIAIPAAPGDATAEVSVAVEIVVEFFSKNLDIPTFYQQDQLNYINGQVTPHLIASDASGNSRLITQFGDFSVKYAPARFILTLHPQMNTGGTTYTLKIPIVGLSSSSTTSFAITMKVEVQTFSSGNAFPLILQSQQFINNWQTIVNNNPTTLNSAQLYQISGDMVQSTSVQVKLNVQHTSFTLYTGDYIFIKINPLLGGIQQTSLDAISGVTVNVGGTWSFNYLKNYHLIMLQLQSSTTTQNQLVFTFTPNFALTQFYIDTYQISWIKIYQQKSVKFINSGSIAIGTLNEGNLGTSTTRSMQLLSSISSINYQSALRMLLKITTPYKLVQGGYMEINLLGGGLEALTTDRVLGFFCQPGKNIFRSTNNLPLQCVRHSSTQFILSGFAEISAGTTFQVSFYLRCTSATINSNAVLSNTIFYGTLNTFNKITTIPSIQGVSPIVLSGEPWPTTYQSNIKNIQLLFDNERGPLQFTYQLDSSTLDGSQGDRMQIIMPSSNRMSITKSWPHQTTDVGLVFPFSRHSYTSQQWINSKGVSYDGTSSSFTMLEPSGYTINSAFGSYDLLLDTQMSLITQNNGIMRPDPGVYRFQLKGQFATGTVTTAEYGYYDYIVLPKPDQNFQIFPLILNAGMETIYKFTYTIQNRNVLPGDEIWLQFTTHNYFRQIFADDLGYGLSSSVNSTELDCREQLGQSHISGSSSTRIRCYMYKGDYTTKRPALIKIPVSGTITASTTIVFFVAQIRNPVQTQDVSTVQIFVQRQCRHDGMMCAWFQSANYFQTTAADTVSYDSQHLINSTSVATGYVSDVNRQHTFSFYCKQALNANDYILIYYKQENYRIEIQDCIPNGPVGDVCMVFPIAGFIFYQTSVALPVNQINSVEISGLNNGWYAKGYGINQIQFWHSSARSYAFAIEVQPIYFPLEFRFQSISFKPTQTNQTSPYYRYILRDFENVLEIDLLGMWYKKDVKQIWVLKPTNIDWFNQSYCNASLIIPEAQRLPYPLRLKCTMYTDRISLDFMPRETGNFNGWNYPSYILRLYLKAWVNLLATPGPSNPVNFISYSTVDSYDTVINLDHGVCWTQGSIFIDPYDMPDLNDLTFNTLSFYNRKARIGDMVEYYMLIKPISLLSYRPITKMVFRLPDEFSYPPTNNLDSCKMFGKRVTPILSCTLDRVEGKSFVTAQLHSSFDHAIKIMRLSQNDPNLLFTAPELPGTHYNISNQMYSNIGGGILAEANTINLTNVLGYDLEVALITINAGLDAETPSLYQFDFTIGSTNVPAGYDSPTATTYSKIHFIFETKKGYEQDLGMTGMKTGDEVACIVRGGISVIYTKKLQCFLKTGTTTTDLPAIIVTGYDEIKAGTAVSILVTSIKNLPIGKQMTIKIGVQLIYKKYGGVSAFYYEPTAFVPPAPSAFSAINSAQLHTVTYVGSTQVLGLTNYTFTFSAGAQPITSSDYFALEFPKDFFNRFTVSAEDSQPIVCLECSELYVFGITNMIYLKLKPTQVVAANAVGSFTISNLINPAYQLDGTFTIKGHSIINDKQNQLYQFLITRDVQPCNKFQSVSATADSNIGGQNNVTFEFNIITGHIIPIWGALSIYFPTTSTFSANLLNLQANCSLKGLSSSLAQCKIGSQNRIDIFLNGANLDKIDLITLKVFNLNTPNIDSSQLQFTITSYYDSNIYLDHQICQMNFPFPLIKSVTVKGCYMQVQNQYQNTLVTSQYTFTFSCTQVIRDNTILTIRLPKEYLQTNFNQNQGDTTQTTECSSDKESTLASKQCTFYIDEYDQFLVAVKLRNQQSQTRFLVKVILINPSIPNNNYIFTANFSCVGVLYASTMDSSSSGDTSTAAQKGTQQQQQVSIIQSALVTQTSASQASVSQTTSSNQGQQVKLTNIPKNAGESSIYVVTVPPIQGLGSVQEMQILFPPNFSKDIGDQVTCGLYSTQQFDDNFLTYKNLLSITEGKVIANSGFYNSVSCSITQDYAITMLNINSAIGNKTMSENWFHWIIRNVQNPSNYKPGANFTLLYKSDKSISWIFQGDLRYYISEAPPLIKLQDLQISDNNIKSPAVYNFTLFSPKELAQIPSLGIVIKLPPVYKDVIAQQVQSSSTASAETQSDDLMQCQLKSSRESNAQIASECNFYGWHLLLEGFTLRGANTNVLNISVSKIINPLSSTNCLANSKSVISNVYFDIKLISLNSGEIIGTTSSSVDDKNCFEFSKKTFNIIVKGPTILQAGLSYTYQIELEQPGQGLVIQPNCQINGITFEPASIEFNEYSSIKELFKVKVRSDVLPGSYLITFTKTEQGSNNSTTDSSDGIFFLPILPISIEIVPFNPVLNEVPTITLQNVETDSVGYPITIPIQVSQEPANLINLIVEPEFVDSSLSNSLDITKILEIVPKSIDITPQTKTTYFQIIIKSATVPPAITLKFSLFSFYSVVHQLKPSQKTIIFSRNKQKISDPPALHFFLQDNVKSTPLIDLNKPVLNLFNAQGSSSGSGASVLNNNQISIDDLTDFESSTQSSSSSSSSSSTPSSSSSSSSSTSSSSSSGSSSSSTQSNQQSTQASQQSNTSSTTSSSNNNTSSSSTGVSTNPALDQLNPKIMSIESINIKANQAEIKVYTTLYCTIYYMYTLQGVLQFPTVKQIIKKSFNGALGYGKQITDSIYSKKSVDYNKIITLDGLEAQTNYAIYFVAASSVGRSQVNEYLLKTARLTFGAVIQIPIIQLVSPENVIAALSKTLRLPPERFLPITSYEDLKNEYASYKQNIMTKPALSYQIVIKPNSFSDNPSPQYYSDLLLLTSYKIFLKKHLPEFDDYSNIKNTQIRQTAPDISIEPYPVKIDCYNATFELRLWEQGKVYALIRDYQDNIKNPLSKQIFKGVDELNRKIKKSRTFSSITDDQGKVTMQFDDLADNSKYNLYVTIGSNMPYDPLILFEDSKVRKLTFTTPKNNNIGLQNELSLNILKKANPKLATTIEKIITDPSYQDKE